MDGEYARVWNAVTNGSVGKPRLSANHRAQAPSQLPVLHVDHRHLHPTIQAHYFRDPMSPPELVNAANASPVVGKPQARRALSKQQRSLGRSFLKRPKDDEQCSLSLNLILRHKSRL